MGFHVKAGRYAMALANRLSFGKARDARLRLERVRRKVSRRVHGLGGTAPRTPGEERGINPENIVWIFGGARTGSTWLGSMMKDLEGHDWWHEPMVGHLFGRLYEEQSGRRSDDFHFILGGGEEHWLGPVREFVLAAATVRFPGLVGRQGYLVVKEPHGTQGAPLLMRALPESRMVLLVRDPRDVVASRMDLAKKGGVVREAAGERGGRKNTAADERPDAFAKTQARRYLRHVELAKGAYDAHAGPKALIRYEDLRADALGSMRSLYAALEIPASERDLARVVRKHAWENVPEGDKGSGMFRRKATPGGWSEDLTPRQSRAVEDITAPFLREFYPEERRSLTQG